MIKSERLSLARALRERLHEGYDLADFRADLSSGAIVALVALPLAMALSIASGVSPENGVFTAIIGGFFIALLGGSRFQVSGPTAAFVVLLAPVAQDFGLRGLFTAGFMAGILLVIMAFLRLGRLIRLIPLTVIIGFTTGIAIVIATLQLKDFLGLQFANPESYFGKISALAANVPLVSWPDLAIGIFTLAVLLFWPKLKNPIPAPLVSLFAAALGGLLLHEFAPTLMFQTIGTRFGQPNFSLNLGWNLDMGSMPSLLSSAVAIALLGAIESLLSATIADGMTKTQHHPDSELMALGVGNILCPFFGGIAATGAIARTATNIRYGARSPISAMMHAAIILLSVSVLSTWMVHLPMAALAALLLLVAYNISDIKHFVHITKSASRSDIMILWTCFLLTVFFDMIIGVAAGVALASLFSRVRSTG